MSDVPLPKGRRRTLDQRIDGARLDQNRAAAKLERKTRQVEKYVTLKRSRERKLDTRRKIIAGALALEHMKRDGAFRAALLALLDEYVTKEPERLLFGLTPLPDDAAPTAAQIA